MFTSPSVLGVRCFCKLLVFSLISCAERPHLTWPTASTPSDGRSYGSFWKKGEIWHSKVMKRDLVGNCVRGVRGVKMVKANKEKGVGVGIGGWA